MTRVLVTGASGFIGSHLVPVLQEAADDVVEADRASGDVAEESTWAKYPAAQIVIHLAGKSSVPDSWSNPTAFIRNNLLGTVAALNYCRRHHARLVLLSSYLYGNPERLPIPETAPLISTSPYALSKKLAEEACRFYTGGFGVRVTILRPFNVHGPGQPEHLLIPSIIRQLHGRQRIEVKDLEPRRDYVYVQDLIRSIVKAMHCEGEQQVFNIGTGLSHSVDELIQIIQDLAQTDLPVHSTGERRKNEIMDTVADITAAKQHLGWAPQWTLADGIRQMLRAGMALPP